MEIEGEREQSSVEQEEGLYFAGWCKRRAGTIPADWARQSRRRGGMDIYGMIVPCHSRRRKRDGQDPRQRRYKLLRRRLGGGLSLTLFLDPGPTIRAPSAPSVGAGATDARACLEPLLLRGTRKLC